MHTHEIRKIQESFRALLPRADEVGLMFYERLFAIHPGMRGLFPEYIAPQSRKLVQMLALVVNSLDRKLGLAKA